MVSPLTVFAEFTTFSPASYLTGQLDFRLLTIRELTHGEVVLEAHERLLSNDHRVNQLVGHIEKFS